ncbi:MAG TPA: hypothetical protein VF733_01725 [Candidatus Saccharimonadales bacterium]
MSQTKRRIFNTIPLKAAILLIGAIMSCFAIPAGTASAHHAADCSDVYTPISTSIMDKVNFNKSAYIQAMNETGVPWEMLAAIHYRETNFSRSNPSNGQGIFQFTNGAGGPYPAGPVSDAEFYRQLVFMANRIQDDYVWRGSLQRERRRLQPNEQNVVLVKDTLFSYNGRATVYANQATHFGYNSSTQPYEGSPYVMNRFNCDRARMGIITQDYGSMDGIDTRYGTFTLYARLRGEDYWRSMWYAYSWQIVGQYAYTDQNKTTGRGTSNLLPGTRVYVGFRARNNGTTTWVNNGAGTVNIGTERPLDRASPFADGTWIGPNRPARMIEASVAPGEIGTFEFWITAPNAIGSYREYFNLVAEGVAWFPSMNMYFDISVAPPTWSWQPIGQYAYTDQNKTTGKSTTNLSPGERVYVGVKARNTGNMTWKKSGANTVLLGTTRNLDRASVFADNTWPGVNRAANLVETEVAPGEIGTFEFWMTARNTPGARAESFTPVVEGVTWMNDVGFNFFTSIINANYSWQFEGQYSYTDQTKTTGKATTGLNAGDRIYVGFRAKNIGNVTWFNSGPHPINVGMTQPLDRLSRFFDNGWLGQNRPARMIESSVAPGQTATFEFWMKAQPGAGIYREYFSLVAEGAAWMNDPRMNYYMSVN